MSIVHIQLIGDYSHMTTTNEHVNLMKLAHLFSFFPLSLRVPFCTSTITFKFLITSNVHVHTRGRKKNKKTCLHVNYVR